MDTTISNFSVIFLESLVGHGVLITLTTGDYYRGLLCYVDDDMNIELQGAEFLGGNAIVPVGDIRIEGNFIDNAQLLYTCEEGRQRSAAQRAITFEGDYEIPVMMEEYGAPVDETLTSTNQDSRSLMLDTGLQCNAPQPGPSTLVPHPSISLPDPSNLLPGPSTLLPGPSTLLPDPSTLVPQPSTLVPQPSTLVPQPSTLVPQPSISLPGPSTLLPDPSTFVPQPSISLPGPSTQRAITFEGDYEIPVMMEEYGAPVDETLTSTNQDSQPGPSNLVPHPSISLPGPSTLVPHSSMSVPCLSHQQYPHPYHIHQFGLIAPPACPSSTDSSTTLVGDSSGNNSGSTTPQISPTVSEIDASSVQPDSIFYTEIGVVPAHIRIAVNFDGKQGTALISDESQQTQNRLESHGSAEMNPYVYDNITWPTTPNASPRSSYSGLLPTELGPNFLSGSRSYEADPRIFQQAGPSSSQRFPRTHRSVPTISQAGPSMFAAWTRQLGAASSIPQTASNTPQTASGAIEAGPSSSLVFSNSDLASEASSTSSSSTRHNSHTSRSDDSNK